MDISTQNRREGKWGSTGEGGTRGTFKYDLLVFFVSCKGEKEKVWAKTEGEEKN